MNKQFTLALAAAAGIAALSSPVFAADLVVYDDAPPVMDMGSSVDWEGAYIGGLLGYYPDDPSYVIGAQIGYNFLASEMFLIGLQATGQYSPDGGYFEGWLDMKAGVALESFALYGLGGLGIQDDGDTLWRLGVGAEVMVAEGFSLFAEGGVSEDIGDTPDVPFIQGGVRFHF
jgi:hypothetical protein